MDSIDSQQFLTNVATNIVEDSAKNAWNKIKKFFLDLDAKDSIRYKTAYEKYLINTEQKVSKIKTIIYRRAPKDLYSFYECIGVLYNGNTINTENINNLLEIGNKIIVTGTGGVGKSILFKHLFLNTVAETEYIPVLIELRSFNIHDVKDISIYTAIYKCLVDNGFELSEEYFEYSLREGAYIIFFDGYDEVNRDKTEKITSEIKALSEKYGENKFFISSRPSEEFIGWNDFCEVETLKLNKQQALNLVKKLEFDEVVKDTFYKELDRTLYDKYESFASNPLLLNIMLLTFQKHASIPERLNDFYDEAFVTLFNVHDATKDSYVRDIRSGLGCEDFKLVFSYICFKSYFNGEFQFSESRIRFYIQQAKEKFDRFNFTVENFQEDLTQSVCMLVKEGGTYRFSHRSFQEYFAAWYTCKLVDDVQAKLLLNWIQESDSVFSDSYFTMLFDLQSEKVNKIILCPILKEVKKLYLQYGFSIDLLNILFEGMKFTKRLNGEEMRYSTSLTIKNQYLCYGLMLNNRLNMFPYSDNNDKQEKQIFEKMEKYMVNKNHKRNARSLSATFDEVLEVLKPEELLKHLEWFQNQIEFAIQIVEKYDDRKISRKKKVSTILEEL
jgi:hypothetical protein